MHLSEDPVAIIPLLSTNTQTACWWPERVYSHSLVEMFHILTVPSQLPLELFN